MSNSPKKTQKPESKGQPESSWVRAQQLADQRRREMATRSTLARLRNRKSDLK